MQNEQETLKNGISSNFKKLQKIREIFEKHIRCYVERIEEVSLLFLYLNIKKLFSSKIFILRTRNSLGFAS